MDHETLESFQPRMKSLGDRLTMKLCRMKKQMEGC